VDVKNARNGTVFERPQDEASRRDREDDKNSNGGHEDRRCWS
jgi:hypothetical protein